jgi:hypothetical protein
MTLLDNVAQVGIMFCGGGGVLLLGTRSPNVRRWGYVVALCGEPFWLYSAVHASQWGVIAMGALYTVGWIRGIYNHFGHRAVAAAPSL